MKLANRSLLVAVTLLMSATAWGSNVSDWNTAAASNNAAPPNGAPEGMAPSTVNDIIRENMGAVARWYSDVSGTLVTTGTANAYVLTTNSAHATLADQAVFRFRADRANTGAATLNVDTLGAFAIELPDGSALTTGMLALGGIYDVTFDAAATPDRYVLTSPSSGIVDLTTETLTVQDSGATDSVVVSHDGTDASFAYTNTNIVNSTGASAYTFDDDVRVLDGGTFRVYDATSTDFASFIHDGTDFNAIYTNTTRVFELGAASKDFTGGMDVRIRDGADFQLFDATDVDTATFSHDGTSFNTSFTNTTSWLVSGLSSELRVQAGLTVEQGNNFSIFDATNADSITMSHDGTNLNISGSGTNAIYNTVSTYFRDGPVTRFYDSGNTDYAQFTHDGTNFNVAATNTAGYLFSGMTYVGAAAGADIRVLNATNTDYLQIEHDGTNAIFSAINTNAIDFDGVNTRIRGGAFFTVWDSGNTDSGSFFHDGVDFNTQLSNTTDWNITGITALNIAGDPVTVSDTSSFSASVTGGTGGAATTFQYEVVGQTCTIHNPSVANVVTSNSTSMTLATLPVQCQPASVVVIPCIVLDNGISGFQNGMCSINGGTITFYLGSPLSASGFTASGTKGLPIGWSITFPLT